MWMITIISITLLYTCVWGHASADPEEREEIFHGELAKRMLIYHKVYLKRNLVNELSKSLDGEHVVETRTAPVEDDIVAEKVFVADDVVNEDHDSSKGILNSPPESIARIRDPIMFERMALEHTEGHATKSVREPIFNPFSERKTAVNGYDNYDTPDIVDDATLAKLDDATLVKMGVINKADHSMSKQAMPAYGILIPDEQFGKQVTIDPFLKTSNGNALTRIELKESDIPEFKQDPGATTKPFVVGRSVQENPDQLIHSDVSGTQEYDPTLEQPRINSNVKNIDQEILRSVFSPLSERDESAYSEYEVPSDIVIAKGINMQDVFPHGRSLKVETREESIQTEDLFTGLKQMSNTPTGPIVVSRHAVDDNEHSDVSGAQDSSSENGPTLKQPRVNSKVRNIDQESQRSVFSPLSAREESAYSEYEVPSDIVIAKGINMQDVFPHGRSLKVETRKESVQTEDLFTGLKQISNTPTGPIVVSRHAVDDNEHSDVSGAQDSSPENNPTLKQPRVNSKVRNIDQDSQRSVFSPLSSRDESAYSEYEVPSDIIIAKGINMKDVFPHGRSLKVETRKESIQTEDLFTGLKQISNTPTGPIIVSRDVVDENEQPVGAFNEKYSINSENGSFAHKNIIEYYLGWHTLPKELTRQSFDKLEQNDQKVSLPEAISEAGITDLFMNSFWPFKYGIVEMNQRVALYGITGKQYDKNVKSRYYNSLYSLYLLPVPINEHELLVSFNDHNIAELLSRSKLLNGSDNYIENKEYAYSEQEKSTLTNKINAAMKLIKQTSPELYRSINQLITCIALYKSEHADRVGGSSSALPGVIYLTPIPNKYNWSVPFYAEQIVHEFIHNALYLEEFVIGTYNSHMILSKAKVFSSIRGVPRNYDLSLHASYVSTGLVVFHSRAGYHARAEHYAGPLAQAVQGLVDTNKEHGVLTVAGEAMLQTLVDFVTVMKIGRLEL